jgi:hypothetical protein
VQHRTAQQHAGEGGEASASGLIAMAKHPMFLLAIAGDAIGFVLQIIALAAGPVVFIQPLVVLMLPVSLGVSFLMGGHRPRVGDYLGVAGVLGGLSVFLALIGHPGDAHVPRSRYIALAIAVVLVVGIVLCLAVQGRNKVIKGAMYGAVAGGYFGTLAVMVDAASDRFSRHGFHGLFVGHRGLVPLVGIVVLGAGGIILTQVSFQVGALGATLPANLAVDPLMGVLLGAVLLSERVPYTAWHLAAYTLCLAAIVAGAIRLADPQVGGVDPDEQPEDPVGGPPTQQGS